MRPHPCWPQPVPDPNAGCWEQTPPPPRPCWPDGKAPDASRRPSERERGAGRPDPAAEVIGTLLDVAARVLR